MTTPRFFGLRLARGVGRGNVATYYFAAAVSICLLSFINVIQPFLLTNFLGIPVEEHGVVAGGLTFGDESIGQICIALAGVFSDRFGQRIVFAAGQIDSIVTAQVLVQHQAPSTIRGSVIGYWGLCGLASILVTTSLGGLLFDRWIEAGPLVMMGGFSLVLIVWALSVYRRIAPLR